MKPKITIFDPTQPNHKIAIEIYQSGAGLPLICPHGHVDPSLFAEPNMKFNDPAELFVIPDHYVLRMLVSRGIKLDQLGISPKDEKNHSYDPRFVWQVFCDHFHFFDGTPSGLWIENELSMVFDIEDKPNSSNAGLLYEKIKEDIDSDAFSPRKLFERFNIDMLCTTDSISATLQAHQKIINSEWQGQVKPTLRPDAVVNINHPQWREAINALGRVCNLEITDYRTYIHALEDRRTYFRSMGAVATDHAAETAYICHLSPQRAETLFQKGLRQEVNENESRQFTGHMIFEMARMSVEDGLVMQFHVGSFRNHSLGVLTTFGPDMGFDIPVKVEWTRNLKPLLDAFGMDPRLRLILFTLDESGYARELAPIAGAYPAVLLGPPWWFHDSPNGMLRYFENVMETAGIDNTVGFTDDTRAFLSIPARHDLWRRMSALWSAKLVCRGQLDLTTAKHRMTDLAYRLAKRGYRLDR